MSDPNATPTPAPAPAVLTVEQMTREQMFEHLKSNIASMFDEFEKELDQALGEGHAAIAKEARPDVRAQYQAALSMLESRRGKIAGYKSRAQAAIDLVKAGSAMFVRDLAAANSGEVGRLLEREYRLGAYLKWERDTLLKIATKVDALEKKVK